MLENGIIIAILLAVIGLAAWYVIRSKKRGRKCIGCPEGCCSAKNDGTACCCGCGETSAKDDQE